MVRIRDMVLGLVFFSFFSQRYDSFTVVQACPSYMYTTVI